MSDGGHEVRRRAATFAHHPGGVDDLSGRVQQLELIFETHAGKRCPRVACHQRDLRCGQLDAARRRLRCRRGRLEERAVGVGFAGCGGWLLTGRQVLGESLPQATVKARAQTSTGVKRKVQFIYRLSKKNRG